jgi:hypothetical protein
LANSTHETLASHLYQTLNALSGLEFQKLSRATARQLASTYTGTLLLTTLDTLNQRALSQTIRNPVGFFITLVRSSHRNLFK